MGKTNSAKSDEEELLNVMQLEKQWIRWRRAHVSRMDWLHCTRVFCFPCIFHQLSYSILVLVRNTRSTSKVLSRLRSACGGPYAGLRNAPSRSHDCPCSGLSLSIKAGSSDHPHPADKRIAGEKTDPCGQQEVKGQVPERAITGAISGA